jgi:hypothetical protein
VGDKFRRSTLRSNCLSIFILGPRHPRSCAPPLMAGLGAPAGPGLGRLKVATVTEQRVCGRHSDIVENNLCMAMRGFVIAEGGWLALDHDNSALRSGSLNRRPSGKNPLHGQLGRAWCVAYRSPAPRCPRHLARYQRRTPAPPAPESASSRRISGLNGPGLLARSATLDCSRAASKAIFAFDAASIFPLVFFIVCSA